ncbi:probable DIP5 - Glutamate and aspartate permease - able to mediate transport of other amino acids [Ustilago trichophora]|uniref:Probable DIP5 - Glutamate and aspartate permease - able to mediate transport of other amino acids n=1 Tax=Ustilago trichophora TaxID=86804 RepID=A0A5C3EHL4_9BASI|nr:probable DIP5 - Glutamate and aspartate permease - able to mediate transport of other amino acids [Ustilago trichophora]
MAPADQINTESPYYQEKASSSGDEVKGYDNHDGVAKTSSFEAEKPAEERQLHRALKGRQISMIAIGGALGTGLIIGTGTGLANGGPASILISYSVMGFCCAAVMSALGEMSTYMPHPRGFAGHATRFVSDEFGVATGYNYLFKYLVVTANNINAAALVIRYWNADLSGGIWIAIVTVLIIALNFGGPKWFGEVEFWLSLVKIITMTGLILLLLIIDLGGSPTKDRIGFRNFQDGLAFRAYPKTSGSKGMFLGFWSTMVTALFAYTGTELVGVTVGEAANPRKSVPSAIKKTFFRIAFFYILGALLVGMVVPSNAPQLLAANKKGTSAAASPFVVAIIRAKIRVLPDIINAAILIFCISAANSDQYIAARTLYGLAIDGKAPKIFRRVDKRGVPYVALSVTALFCGLAFINLASGGPQTFSYLVASVTMFGGLTWICILISHIHFMKAMKAQGMARSSLPWQAPLQPYSSYIAVVFTAVVVFFKGWNSFLFTFNWRTFLTNYIGLPIFFIILIGWKLWHKTKFIKPTEVDLLTDVKEFDEQDELIWKQDEEKAAAEIANAPLYKKAWVYAKNW